MRNAGGAGRYNAAGLPGIEGSVGAWIRMTEGTGAFYTPTEQAGNIGNEEFVTLTYNAPKTTFDASRCNEQYGSSDTVMPASADLSMGLYLGSLA